MPQEIIILVVTRAAAIISHKLYLISTYFNYTTRKKVRASASVMQCLDLRGVQHEINITN